MINIKLPSTKNQKYIENFFIKKNLRSIVDFSKKEEPSVNQMVHNELYIPYLSKLNPSNLSIELNALPRRISPSFLPRSLAVSRALQIMTA